MLNDNQKKCIRVALAQMGVEGVRRSLKACIEKPHSVLLDGCIGENGRF